MSIKLKLNKKSITFLVCVILAILCCVLIYKLTHKHIDIKDPYPKENIELIIQDEIIEFKNPPLYENNEILLPLDLVKRYIDPKIVWDSRTNKVIITTNDNVIKMNTAELTAYVNNEEISLNVNPQEINGAIYMPIEFLQDVYGIELTYLKDSNILIIDYVNTIKKVVTINLTDVKIYSDTNPKSEVIAIEQNLNDYENFDNTSKASIVKNGKRWYHVKNKEKSIEGYVMVPEGGLYIHQDMDEKSPVIWRANPVDVLWGFEEEGDWCKVRTMEGRLGYIEKSKIKIHAYKDGTYTVEGKVVNKDIKKDDQLLIKKEAEAQVTTGSMTKIESEIEKIADGKINAAWQYVGKNPDVSTFSTYDGLDVIMPTFFDLGDSNGNVDSRANIGYVKWANNNGYKVWGMLKNDFEGLGRRSEIQRRKYLSDILNDDEKRERVIKQTLTYADLYKLDGINIDFENMEKDEKGLFTQFVREFYPLAKEQGLVLSVDVGMPNGSDYYSLCYDRDELSKCVDYIIVMAYDQHWASSPVSGSVAAYDWMETGIKGTIKEGVPAEKLILGVPFYVRRWKEQVSRNSDGDIISRKKIDTTVMTMNEARNDLSNHGVTPVWDDSCGQYYGEYEEGGYLYRIWLEDEDSIYKKASLVHRYGLAGTCAWSLGFERSQVWLSLKQVLKEQLNYNDWVMADRMRRKSY